MAPHAIRRGSLGKSNNKHERSASCFSFPAIRGDHSVITSGKFRNRIRQFIGLPALNKAMAPSTLGFVSAIITLP